jgi:hypothetical protein
MTAVAPGHPEWLAHGPGLKKIRNPFGGAGCALSNN